MTSVASVLIFEIGTVHFEDLNIQRILDQIRNRRWDEVNFLLNSRELYDLNTFEKSTLLTELAYHRGPKFIYFLVSQGADPNFRFHGEKHSVFSYDLNPGTTPIGQTILGSEREKIQLFLFWKLC